MTWELQMKRQFRAVLSEFARDQKRLALKKFDLMESIERNPYEGIGKPEMLKHQLSGLWSRRIDGEHRLIYQINEETNTVLLVSCFGHYTDL
jgi:toxin YoeB